MSDATLRGPREVPAPLNMDWIDAHALVLIKRLREHGFLHDPLMGDGRYGRLVLVIAGVLRESAAAQVTQALEKVKGTL